MKAKGLRALMATALFMAILIGVYVTHARYLAVDVVFYGALQDATIAIILASIALFTVPIFRQFSSFERAQLVVIFALLGYVFAISVPTVIDRSLSLYILEKLQQRGGAIREDAFPGIFVEEYMAEYRLIDVRLTEQLESGTITIDRGCVRLTAKGRALADGSSWFRRNLLPRQRQLRGHYTSELTTPFRNGTTPANYRCR